MDPDLMETERTMLNFLERRPEMSLEHLLQKMEEKGKGNQQKVCKRNEKHFDLMRAHSKANIDITKNEIEEMSDCSPTHEKHLVNLHDCLFDI